MPKPTATRPIAFYSAEYALEDTLPIYAGGLGVLSADMTFEAGTQGVPFVGFGLLYRHGFVTADAPPPPHIDPVLSGYQLVKEGEDTLTVEVEFDDCTVKVQAWEKHYGSARMLLLDTDHPDNTPEQRAFVSHLYDADYQVRIRAEWVLGLGSVKLLRRLKLDPVIYHLNEGHTSFVIMGLWLDYLERHPHTPPDEALTAIRPLVVGTKHTILSGSGLVIDRPQFDWLVGDVLRRNGIDFDDFFNRALWHGDPNLWSSNRFLMDHAVRRSGVSRIHVAMEQAEHPEGKLEVVTNGIHLPRWEAPNFAGRTFAELTDDDLWNFHEANKAELVAHINKVTGSSLSPTALTVVWARRITSYKRPELLFNDLQRLADLTSLLDQPVQFVLGGKPNPSDPQGPPTLERLLQHTKRPEFKDKIVYLPGYSVPVTRQLVAGADVWLNTPIRGQEACGTSGMKASLNGALQFSTSDGWVDEVPPHQVGWILPEEHTETAIYDILEQIANLFYDRGESYYPVAWTARMRQVMTLIRTQFSATRMLSDYQTRLYQTAPPSTER